MNNTIEIIGTTSDIDTCDCCGRQGLNKVVILMVDGKSACYGTGCAATLLYGKKASRKQIDVVVARATAIQFAKKWLTAGTEPAKVAHAIWNKFGYAADIHCGALRIAGFDKDMRSMEIARLPLSQFGLSG